MRTPSAGTPIEIPDLLRGLFGGSVVAFEDALRGRLSVPWCRVTGSGTSALYVALLTLRTRSDRRKVVLPAYTAPSLILPIRKAGLEPVLSEISLATLNAGSCELLERVDRQTLAVVPVHMFGLPMDVSNLTQALGGSGTWVLEDACSAMGTAIDGRQAGTLGDVGFYSFNRGKNLSTLSGGALVCASQEVTRALEDQIDSLEQPGLAGRARIVLSTAGLAAAVRPLGYTLLYSVVSRYKYTELHTDFEALAYGGLQAGIGESLLRRWDRIARARIDNATRLRRALSDVEAIRLPTPMENALPVHNQFPILLRDQTARDAVHRAILDTGLEATVLYPDPIHRIYPDVWDGTGPDPYPNATELSTRLLLIPVHPLVSRSALEAAVDVVKRTA